MEDAADDEWEATDWVPEEPAEVAVADTAVVEWDEPD